MSSGDLGAVLEIAERVHPDHPESGRAFASRLVRFPAGCFTAAAGTERVGYCFSHPWRLGQVPLLDSILELPDAPDCLYLHDLALLPDARGQGLAESMVEMLVAVARAHGFDRMALTAVSGSWRFWERHDFHRHQCGLLPGYGEVACYMVKVVTGQ
ncbi:GNAT family N-acetyltransferase [Magnetospirillum sp. UT-4]|uniref:GNAT family N-acetyltransferase n=1 Tax=Magnetospirillum sp. UT-4 TaxID=2681467 RepID=UPI00138370CD|nr:GNAT family N-acetyltransferase [Magnetospirillum sp. UT-4]CAA7611531.1 putative acetyltransferase [Magnetospirillum sp. UT-4]